jgi:hypothetical protein
VTALGDAQDETGPRAHERSEVLPSHEDPSPPEPRSLRPNAVEPAAAPSASGTNPDNLGVPSMLQPGPGGTFVYQGSGFKATVEPNGSVRMKDRYGRLGIMAGTFDLNSWAEAKAGNDPYLSERRAFFEGTRTFREALIKRADERTLRRQLMAIRFDRNLSPSERKTRTFELWDEMVEDEKGEEGREILEEFIRERYTGQDQFTRDELNALNARRQSKQAFEP